MKVKIWHRTKGKRKISMVFKEDGLDPIISVDNLYDAQSEYPQT